VPASPVWFLLFKCSVSIIRAPGGPDGKQSACHAGKLGVIPGLGKFPGEGNGNPLQNSCLENPHGQRSLVGFSPWVGKEADMTDNKP
jgi:hypothetical protein